MSYVIRAKLYFWCFLHSKFISLQLIVIFSNLVNILVKSSRIYKELNNNTNYINLDTLETTEKDNIPDIQFTSCPAIPNTSNYKYKSSLYNLKGAVCVVATLLSPKSSGYIKLKSNYFYDMFLID